MTDRPDPMRVVADVDVLAADVFLDGSARAAVSLIRESPDLTLVVTDDLLTEARDLIADFTDDSVAAAWERCARTDFHVVDPSSSGHPALVAAEAGDAATVLTHDEQFQTASAGVAIRTYVETSVKSPEAFVALVERSSFETGG